MHEASIAMSILRIANSAMGDRKDAKVVRIEVAIGKLKAIEPEFLVQCFTALAKGTLCESAKLQPREVPVTVRCRSCSGMSEIQRFHFKCDFCSASDLEILSGRELKVEKIHAKPTLHK
ncbi:hydrogenase maturation nickel metallochaperone HypA [Pseudovibrio sp. POLY-S9]|uniref:hydrogenase maturation nickel metallochaperone HypA/HybF n=1 Tax=Pseudovibrio sp. POLY-S9 TaxID=1576596 RepID=UPI00070CE67F|nr:hydrogenase maturation nickel metallochaperone HypA [Pseudovibrio sp. POLY-S9]